MMALPVYSYGNWTFNYDASALRKMQNWGITERLQKITVSVDRDAPVCSEFINFLHEQKFNGSQRRDIRKTIDKQGAPTRK